MGLPDFLIIGAAKSGTTSLHHYLGAHPQIRTSARKELRFFCADSEMGLDEYRAQFPEGPWLCGEASPQYAFAPLYDGVPERIAAVVPDVKLIYLVREPVDRALASYAQVVAGGWESRSLSDSLSDLHDNRYLLASQYGRQLALYLRHFRREQILIVPHENLLHRRRQTLREIFGFLGVDEEFYSWRFWLRRHQTRDKRIYSPLGKWLWDLSARVPGQGVLHYQLRRW